MKCLNCGCESNYHVCLKCQKDEIWGTVFSHLFKFSPEECENENVIDYINSFETPEEVNNTILGIINEFVDEEDSLYYYCRYAKQVKESDFEKKAIQYITYHTEWDMRKQIIIRALLDWYGRDDLETPEKLYQTIESTDDLYCELYCMAAEYRAMVGDYDLADTVINKIKLYCKDKSYDKYFSTSEGVLNRVEKTEKLLVRYRAGKPYWPQTEERRKKILEIYAKKGITITPTVPKSKKVAEKDFQMPTEYIGDVLEDYCAFWCAECFSTVKAKDIYEIAAVRVRNDKKVDTYRSFIKPWDAGTSAKKSAAKEAGITEEELSKQRTVDVVMKEFFEFVGEDILVSTDAMGKQRDYLSRAARYAQMSTIKNNLLDILYYAEDISENYEGKNNTRTYIIKDLKVKEGKNSLEKAIANHQLYQKLKNLEK